MKEMIIDFSEFINIEKVDFLSGRKVGKKKFEDLSILQRINDSDIKFKIIIDEKKIKGVNDSFIKGFFSEIFNKLKTSSKVYEKFEFETGEYYKNLIDKNFKILESLQ